MQKRERRRGPYDDQRHSSPGFAPAEDAGHDKDDNGDGNGGYGEPDFGIVAVVVDDDDELDGKAEKEEEVEFQKGDVDLECRDYQLRSEPCNA